MDKIKTLPKVLAVLIYILVGFTFILGVIGISVQIGASIKFQARDVSMFPKIMEMCWLIFGLIAGFSIASSVVLFFACDKKDITFKVIMIIFASLVFISLVFDIAYYICTINI